MKALIIVLLILSLTGCGTMTANEFFDNVTNTLINAAGHK